MDFDFGDETVHVNSPVPQFESIGDIITGLLPYIFLVGGLGLLLYLILGGFEVLTSEGNPDKMAAGRGKITHAVTGFIIIFTAYWLVQILELIFGIQIFD